MMHIKTPAQIDEMKKAGALSKAALRLAGSLIKPGVSTKAIDMQVENFIRLHGGIPTFKGYYGYPATLCSSPNSMIVHGIPSVSQVLQEGDIISIDTGATVDGWVGDNAWTFYVGEVSSEAKALCEITRDCLHAAIEQAYPGNRLGDIGHAVQALAEKHGYGVVRDYVGHGVGHVMHEDPNVPNYGKKGRGVRLQEGMVIAIEPMITMGDYASHTLKDGWGVVTDDGSLAAHVENTLAITKDGPVILTKDEFGADCPMLGGYTI